MQKITRGTTPQLTFNLPINAEQITKLNVCFAQNGSIVLEKTLSDATLEGNKIILPLSESDTLLLSKTNPLIDVQLRIGISNNRLASQIYTLSVEQILKDGALV